MGGAAPPSLLADATTDYNLVVEFYKQQRWQLAAETCREFLDRYADDERAATTRLYLAQSLVHLRDFAAAREQFVLFLDKAPEHRDRPLGAYRVGECSYFLGDYTQAREQLAKFLNQYPDHELAEWAMVYLGESQLSLKQFADAQTAFQRAIAKYPQGRLTDEAEYGLARTLSLTGKPQEAIRQFEKVVARKGSRRAPDALFAIGAAHFDSQRFADAASSFERLLEEYPQQSLAPLAALNAGYSRFSLKDFPAALRHFQTAEQQAAQTATARYWIGLTHKGLEQYELAAAAFSKSLTESPNQPLAENLTYQWGDTELRRGNYPKAIELLESVPVKWPQGDHADDSLLLACEAAFRAEDFTRALEIHRKFSATFPQSPLTLALELLHGRILIAQGDQTQPGPDADARYRQAQSVLTQVVAKSTVPRTQLTAAIQLARVSERLKDDAATVRELDGVLKRESELENLERFDAHLLRGNAQLRQKQAAAAEQDYAACLNLAGSNAERKQALTGLVGALTVLKDWPRLEASLAQLKSVDADGEQLFRVAIAAGDAAYDNKAWDAAAAIYELLFTFPADDPRLLPARSGMAHTRYEQGRYQAAADLFQQVGKSPAADLETKSHCAYMVGLCLRQAGDLEKALEQFQATVDAFALKEPTDDPQRRVAALNAYRSAKGGARAARESMKREEADRLYEVAYRQLKLQPVEEQKELDLLINEWADLSYNAEDFTRSDELYELLIKERPESDLADDARLILAESRRYGGRGDDAVKAFESLLADPKSDDFVKQRSLVHLLDLRAEAGDWDKVLAATENLLVQFPESPNRAYARYRRGEALLQKQQYAAAIEELSGLRSQFSQDPSSSPEWWPETWLLLGEAFFLSKDYAKLEQTLAELRNLADGLPILYRADALLGRSLESRARFDEARSAYQKVIDSDSGRGTETAAEAQFRIAESYLKQNNLPAALKEYYKVYAGYDAPRFEAAALMQAGSVDATLKNWRGAVTTYRTLIAEFPDSEFAEKARLQVDEIVKAFPELKTEP